MTLTADFVGLRYSGFKSYNIRRDVEDLSGSFSITFASHDGDDPRFRRGDPVVIYANNVPVLTGYVDQRKISYGVDAHDITLIGRDKVADMVDSTVGHKIELKAPVTLDQVVKTVLKELQMTDVQVINQVDEPILQFTEGEIVSGQIDETVFEFLEKYTRKRQVLMTTDGKGNVVLTRAGQRRASSPLLHRLTDTERNNIKEADKDEDDTDRYHTYRVHSQGNPSAGTDQEESDNSNIVNRNATATDNEIRKSRVLDITAESSTTADILQKRADWEANIRRSRSVTYSCTVQGHTMQNGRPWEPNLLVRVIDDFAEINDMMLIKSVEYVLDLQSGNITRLELVVKDSYTPEPEMTAAKARQGSIGGSSRKRTKSTKGTKKKTRKRRKNKDRQKYVDAVNKRQDAEIAKLRRQLEDERKK